MTALVWKQAAKVWWSAFRDCQALLAMVRAELDAADQRVAEALDERDVAVAAHRELCADYDRQREQLRAVQVELSQRATYDSDPAHAALRDAHARWAAARDRLRAAEHEARAARAEELAAHDAANAAWAVRERGGVAA